MTLIIAEAGVNHNGDMGLARELVTIAAEAGADLVKFQSFSAEKIAIGNAPKAAYQVETTGADETQRQMIARLELSRADHEMLVEECARRGVGFFSTGFDPESIDLLLSLGVDRIKIPSGEMINRLLLEHAAAKGLPIILSTGMAALSEVAEAVELLEAGGLERHAITVLHCNTQYPTPMSDVNLRAMVAMAAALGTHYGYSDHTNGTEIPIAAAALGASVIEKHFTVSRDLPGPDHRASLEPGELKAMVQAIRNVEQALSGDGVKRPSPSETANRAIARPSIVAKVPIHAGEPFSADNLTVKRPGTGISPMRWPEVIGRLAPRDFASDELIET
jgi:N-acetylneuraminate synthase